MENKREAKLEMGTYHLGKANCAKEGKVKAKQ